MLAVLDAVISDHSIAWFQSNGTEIQKFWSSKPKFVHLHDKKGSKHRVHGSAAMKISPDRLER